jgi:hypothetical protein
MDSGIEEKISGLNQPNYIEQSAISTLLKHLLYYVINNFRFT